MGGMATIKTRTRIAVDLDPTERKRLQSLADENERSLAQECRLAIRRHLDAMAKGRGR